MKDERMKILSMVENGKVSVEEAERLLDALYLSRRIAMEQGFEDFAQGVSGIARNIGEKVADGVKAVTPRVVEITKTVAEKTADAVETASDAIRDSVKKWNDKREEDGCDCGCGCGNGEPPIEFPKREEHDEHEEHHEHHDN